jgi:trk system potassium uptake protein TrkH
MPFYSMPFVLSILIPAMFIGGSLASTTGGIKLFRLLVSFKVFYRIILKPFLPREEISPFLFKGELLDEESIRRILTLILLEGILIFFSTLVFVIYGFEFLPAFFEVTSAMATVGLSTGIVNPLLSPVLKGLLIFLMWMGRVEIFPVMMLWYAILRKGV